MTEWWWWYKVGRMTCDGAIYVLTLSLSLLQFTVVTTIIDIVSNFSGSLRCLTRVRSLVRWLRF
jgi:hypothetical protein